MGRQLRRQTIALLLTVLVVASGIPMGPLATTGSAGFVGTADAVHDCSSTDAAVYAVSGPAALLNGDITNARNWDKCTQNHVSHIIRNMTANDADLVRSDLHSGANDELAEDQVDFARLDNYLNDTETAAWSWLEIELAEDFQNGTTEAGATSRARGSLQDYYSVKAVNLIEQWNTTIVSAETMENTSDHEENVSDSFHTVATSNEGARVEEVSIHNWTTSEVTLPNGTSHTVRAANVYVYATDSNDNPREFYTEVNLTSGSTGNGGLYEYTSVDLDGLRVDAPTADHDPVQYLTFDDYATRYQEISDQSSSLTGEADQFVNTTYDAWETGEINASDVISQNTAMTRLAADQVSGDNTMYRSTAALAMMGLDVPEINGTGTMEVTYGTDTYTGMLLAESAPNGSWEANTSYNTENVTGTTYLVTTNGEMKTLSGDFTTGTFTNETGHAIQQVNHTRPVYKTADTDDVLAKILAQQAYRQQVENREPLLGGGGGMGDGSGLDPMTAAGIGAALVALLVIVTRG